MRLHVRDSDGEIAEFDPAADTVHLRPRTDADVWLDGYLDELGKEPAMLYRDGDHLVLRVGSRSVLLGPDATITCERVGRRHAELVAVTPDDELRVRYPTTDFDFGLFVSELYADLARRERVGRPVTLALELAHRLPPAAYVDRLRIPGQTEAAVLIPLYRDLERGLVAVFTERNADLRKHAGEISFPGGRRDPGEELEETALREAEEEIGLGRADVEVVGRLDPVTTLGTGYRVFPFVGTLEPGYAWAPHDGEVARVLELPLADLRAGRQWRPLLRQGVPVPTVSFVADGHLVWGATARILDQLLRRLGTPAK